MKKKTRKRFHGTTVSEGCYTRPIRAVGDNELKFGQYSFTKERVRKALKRGYGRFTCGSPYNWRLEKSGRVVFTATDACYDLRAGILPKRLVDRIRKWARSR